MLLGIPKKRLPGWWKLILSDSHDDWYAFQTLEIRARLRCS